jgi:hypothetical protein
VASAICKHHRQDSTQTLEENELSSLILRLDIPGRIVSAKTGKKGRKKELYAKTKGC